MRKIAACGALLGLSFLYGCGGVNNEAAVLEGTWQVNFENPGDLEGLNIQATFDANGQLTEITAEDEAGAMASLDVAAGTTTTVVGSDVTITIPVAGGTGMLVGTLSDDDNTIEGSLSREIELPSGDLEVTLPGNNLTLVRL